MTALPSRLNSLRSRAWPTALRTILSTAVALLIMVIDIASHAKGMAGVLYVPLLVAIATEAGRREILFFGLLGVVFAIAAHQYVLGSTPGIVTRWPLGVALTSVIAASILLSRLVASRERLIVTNSELAYSEWRYRSIFEQTRFPFWERDFSGAYAIYDRLRSEGVTSLTEYDREHPGFAEHLATQIVNLNVNDAMLQLVGATKQDEFPRTLADMKPNLSRMLILQQSLFDGATRLDGKSTLVTIDGVTKEIWVTSELSPDPDRPGIMVGMLVDLTEQEKARQTLALAQAELARASRVATVGALSVSIAHELNQPLAAAVMNAQTAVRYLRRPSPDVEAAIAAAERAANEGGRAGAIVKQTRDMATNRVSRDELIDLGALVQEVLNLLDHDIRDSGVDVDVQSTSGRVELLADRVAFQQVLVNLIGNALQAMRDTVESERRLIVAIRDEAPDITVEVRDNGPGIADAHLAQLFEPFFTTKAEGVGVGLAISRAAIEARGGRLRAFNAEGGGAVFEFKVPLEKEMA